jgi:hypothetical protein
MSEGQDYDAGMGELADDMAYIEAHGIKTDVFTNGSDTCSVRLTHPASGIVVTREGKGPIGTRREAIREMRERLGFPESVPTWPACTEQEAHNAALPGSVAMADMFTEWARRTGILPRVTEDQCRDLAAAFMAGYAASLRWQTETNGR